MQVKFLIIVIMSSMFSLSACFGGGHGDTSNIERRLNQQQEEIRRLKVQLASAQPAQAETWTQVQSLRQEMAVLNGKIDDFSYSTVSVGGLSGLAQRLKRIEDALQKLEKQFDVKLLNSSGQSSKPSASPIAVQNTKSSITVGKEPPAKMDPAVLLYDAGVRLFNERKYKESLASFTDFTKNYSSNKLISSAWFWRGETNYQLGNYPAAALDYEKVISNYPKSNKAASSYLKQGLCFYKTGKKEAAKFRLEEVIKMFPDSAEAKRAKQILKSG